MLNAWLGRAAFALGALVVLSAPSMAQPQAAPVALAKLQPGLWQLRSLDRPGSTPQSMCFADPGMMVQVEHKGAPCSRVVIANGASGTTVHYTCPANGFGRTSVKVESPQSATIDTQGIAGNAPFAYRAAARRVGSCS